MPKNSNKFLSMPKEKKNILIKSLKGSGQEKPKTVSSNIVNAGIYVFKPEVFELLSSCQSLEKDLFPKLARIKQLCGFFTHGEYRHLG